MRAFINKKEKTHKKDKSLRDSFLGTNTIEGLPDNFFEKVLQCEVRLKKGFSMSTIQELINYYSIAIEYFESIDDPRYKHYNQSLNLLLSQPEVLKQMSYSTKEGKVKLKKEQRKKKLLTKFEVVDKTTDDKLVNKIITKSKNENYEGIVSKELSDQKSAFEKRKEEKKKKFLLSTSDINLTEQVDAVKYKKKTTNVNKSFDAIDNDQNLFGDIAPITATDNHDFFDQTEHFIEKMNKELEMFFIEFHQIFSEQIVKGMIKEIKKINQNKNEELIKNSLFYQTQIKENEFLLAEKTDQESKDELQSKITVLQNKEKEEKEKIISKYSEKMNSLRQSYEEKNIKAFEWTQKLKAKYISHLEEKFIDLVNVH